MVAISILCLGHFLTPLGGPFPLPRHVARLLCFRGFYFCSLAAGSFEELLPALGQDTQPLPLDPAHSKVCSPTVFQREFRFLCYRVRAYELILQNTSDILWYVFALKRGFPTKNSGPRTSRLGPPASHRVCGLQSSEEAGAQIAAVSADRPEVMPLADSTRPFCAWCRCSSLFVKRLTGICQLSRKKQLGPCSVEGS